VFVDVDDYERSSAYTVGGLCPIQLGCFLGSPPRYRIVSKLGYRAFGWLADDYMATLKIVEAKRTSDSKVAILQRLRAPGAREPHVIQLLDVFEHSSRNGVHQALVMETVHPLDFLRCSTFQPRITRKVVWQMINGLAFIHSRGAAHGG
ncbi:hypothetical protein B0H14DRAFT_2280712, partial [Mycena olivaceomarginata]